MNRVYKVDDGFEVVCDNGEVVKGVRWFEKKTGVWHIKLPANNPTGRTYIRESKLNADGEYEFETKTTSPRVIGSDFLDRMTEEERDEYEELAEQKKEIDERLDELKKLALSRPKPELTEEEKLQREIEKLQAKLKMLKK